MSRYPDDDRDRYDIRLDDDAFDEAYEDDEEEVRDGRARYRYYRDRGYPLTDTKV